MLHLRTIRKETKTKRKDLAKSLGIPEIYIWNIETGKTRLRFDTAVNYLRVCNAEHRIVELVEKVEKIK